MEAIQLKFSLPNFIRVLKTDLPPAAQPIVSIHVAPGEHLLLSLAGPGGHADFSEPVSAGQSPAL